MKWKTFVYCSLIRRSGVPSDTGQQALVSADACRGNRFQETLVSDAQLPLFITR